MVSFMRLTAVLLAMLFAFASALPDTFVDMVDSSEQTQARDLQRQYDANQHYMTFDLPTSDKLEIRFINEDNQVQAGQIFTLTPQLKNAYVKMMNDFRAGEGKKPLKDEEVLNQYLNTGKSSASKRAADNVLSMTSREADEAASRCGGFCRASYQCPVGCRLCAAPFGYRFSKRCIKHF